MSKAIKFNLMLDKHPVRDLDDLRANFNLDELLSAYHSHLLHRWLEVRGLTAELSQIQAIASKNDQTIASTLCQIFHENLSEADIRAAVYPFEFRRQQEATLRKLAEQQFQRDAVINRYHKGYEQLCLDMLANTEDYPFQKSAVATLWADYSQLFEVDFDEFFAIFIVKSPLTLYAMLANEAYRQSGLFDEERKEIVFSSIPSRTIIRKKQIEKEGKTSVHVEDTCYNWRKITDAKVIIKQVYNKSGSVKLKDNKGTEYPEQAAVGLILKGLYFFSYNSSDSVKYAPFVIETVEERVKNETSLPVYYRVFAGITDGYWKDLEPKGTRCLILKMESGNFVRNAKKNGEELNAQAVNKQFLILDGIDYKSNNANHDLIYLVI